MSFCKLSNDTLVSAISVLVKKIFTKNRSDVHYFLTDFSQNGRECVIRFVSLPHSVTCNTDKSIMLQRNKSEAWCLHITFTYFLCLKKKTVNSNVLSLNLKLFQTKMDIKSVIRDYLLRNYVINSNCSFEGSEKFRTFYLL